MQEEVVDADETQEQQDLDVNVGDGVKVCSHNQLLSTDELIYTQCAIRFDTIQLR